MVSHITQGMFNNYHFIYFFFIFTYENIDSRHKNFKDPPYTPSKLFLVKRIKRVNGTNPIERKTLQLLNIDGQVSY